MESIGIKTKQEDLDIDTFLPGIHSEAGIIYYDRDNLGYPGDLLHEAGLLHVYLQKRELK